MVVRGANIEVALPRFDPHTSVLKLIIQSLSNHASKIAQINSQSAECMSFSEILKQSCSISAGLRRKGFVNGDVVVLCCEKSFLAYSLMLGTMFTGCTAVLVHSSVADQIHDSMLGYVVKAVFCQPEALDTVRASVKNMESPPELLAAIDSQDSMMSQLIKSEETFSLHDVEDNTKHVPLVLFSSGSTGPSKGVEITDIGLQRLGYSFDDECVTTYLLSSPFAWISSSISFMSSIMKGYCLVLCNTKEPHIILELIDKYKINGLTLSSAVSVYLNEPSLAHKDLSSLQLVNVGGAVIKKRVIEVFIQKVLAGRTGVQSLYGLTECGILTSWKNTNLLDLSKADSCGYLAPGVEIKILDDHGSEVGVNQIGEIWVKSTSMMKGYWGRDTLTAEVFDKEGFFRTGDAGSFDKDHYLYLHGRYSDFVTIEGNKISVMEAEDILLSHPAVLEAAIVPSTEAEETNHLAAFVVKRQGLEISPEEVIDLTAGFFGKINTLSSVHFLQKLPRTNTGKIQRNVLRGKLAELNNIK